MLSKFFAIWGGQAVSLVTSAILQYAIIWYLTMKTQSALMLSVAMIVAFLPQGILGIFIGVLIDRLNRKTIMIVSDLLIAASSLVLAVVAIYTELPIWLIFAVLAVRSVGTAFHAPSLNAVTPLIVPENMLIKCAGYSQSLQSVSFILSPAIAAVLFSVWPLYAIILLDVVGAVCASGILAFIKIPKPEKKETKTAFLSELKEGLVAVKEQKAVFVLLIIGSLYMLLLMPVSAMFPLITLSHFGGTTMQAGIVESVFAVGMLVGGILLGIWKGFKNKFTTITLSVLIMGATVVFSGMLTPQMYIAFVVLSGIMGLSTPLYSGIQTALIQEKIKPEHLGRVFSLFGSILTLITPIALGISGVFGDTIGVANWFFVSGILMVMLGVGMLFMPKAKKHFG